MGRIQSTLILRSLISLLNLASSDLMWSANSSGELPYGVEHQYQCRFARQTAYHALTATITSS